MGYGDEADRRAGPLDGCNCGGPNELMQHAEGCAAFGGATNDPTKQAGDPNPNAEPVSIEGAVSSAFREFRLRRPRACIEAEMGALEHTANAGMALVLEVLLDIREILDDRLPMPLYVSAGGTVSVGGWPPQQQDGTPVPEDPDKG